MGLPPVYRHILGMGGLYVVDEAHAHLRCIHPDKAGLGVCAKPVACRSRFASAFCGGGGGRVLGMQNKEMELMLMLEIRARSARMDGVENPYAVQTRTKGEFSGI